MSDADFARRALALLDFTELSAVCREDHVEALLQKALGPPGKPAAVCVWPQFVSLCARRLKGSGVRVATVINFPQGGTDIERACEDAEGAVRDGADEIDLVMPYRALMQGDAAAAAAMVSAVRGISRGSLLKVILETGVLMDAALIRRAGEIALEQGADFIKTSTGETAVSATREAAAVLLGVIKAWGKPAGLKPSGGISTLADAKVYLDLADGAMGGDWARPAAFRFGSSALHAAISAVIAGGAAAPSRSRY